jgi:hypothetical protein
MERRLGRELRLEDELAGTPIHPLCNCSGWPALSTMTHMTHNDAFSI